MNPTPDKTSDNILWVRFYIDANNFYRGVSDPYGIKWINFEELLCKLVQKKIRNAKVKVKVKAEKILFFTTILDAKYKDNDPSNHEETPLYCQTQHYGALEENSKDSNNCPFEIVPGSFGKKYPKEGEVFEIVKGSFIKDANTGRKFEIVDASTPNNNAKKTGRFIYGEGPLVVRIKNNEEKKTDVNLAGCIIEDAYISKYEPKKEPLGICCLVSNDSDMEYALKVKKKLGQRVFLITPRIKKNDAPHKPPGAASGDLIEQVHNKDCIFTIEKSLVLDCELPNRVGNFTKPDKWN